jgi:NADH:ubiquinone oxidoreductase subunit B-like Fe-S oxidoreductase
MSWLTTRYETIVRKLENNLQFPWIMASGCCVHELENASLATYDWQRLGVDYVPSDPTQSNLLFIAGWINSKRADEIKRIYGQMRKPTSVIAIGVCALTGSPYLTANSGVIKASDLVPVDVSLAGCPPRPEAILAAILELQRKLEPGPTATEVLYEALK